MVTLVRWLGVLVTACSVVFTHQRPSHRSPIDMDFSSTITVPQARPDQSQALWEQLLQDGFTDSELKVPPVASTRFATLVNDSLSFVSEISHQPAHAWPLRCERWLNRLSTVITGQLFAELSAPKRRAICHAAVTLAGRPELLV